jgi:glycerate kinase
MKVLVVPDSMKDALSAREAAQIIKEAILQVIPDAQVKCCPFSDGGEGLIDVLAAAGLGKRVTVNVNDPLGREVSAELLELETGVFFIEMAQASGLERLSMEERNPLHTSSYGTGQLINYALQKGAHKIFLGMGGSATHDLGCGMAKALGVRFYGTDSQEIDPLGGNLEKITRVDFSHQRSMQQVLFLGVSDVSNILLGEQGAAYIYAAQKGADAFIVNRLEKGSEHVVSLLEEKGFSAAATKGSGAAGGLGFGLVTFLGGKVLNGVEVLSDLVNLSEKVKEADLVITLEGKTDHQTLQGKAPYHVGKLAGEHQKMRLHFTGSWHNALDPLFAEVFDVVVPIQDQPMSKLESIKRVRELLSQAVIRSFRLIKMGQLF